MIALSRARPWPCVAMSGDFYESITHALANTGASVAVLRCWLRERRFERMFSRGDNASRHAERITVCGTTWIECCPRCTKPLAHVEGGCTGACP